MRITFVLERFTAETGLAEVACWPTDQPSMVARFNTILQDDKGLIPTTKEACFAMIEAGIPVSLFEQRQKQIDAKQNYSHIATEQGVRYVTERTPADQGSLTVGVLGLESAVIGASPEVKV